MFTIEQIKAAHSKVRSGADFPAYIRDLKQLGVTFYVTFVKDGSTNFSGADNYKTSSAARFAEQPIASTVNKEQFQKDVKAHQQGATDYDTILGIAAKLGVEKWEVCLEKMTCTYFDKKGNEVMVEKIPS